MTPVLQVYKTEAYTSRIVTATSTAEFNAVSFDTAIFTSPANGGNNLVCASTVSPFARGYCEPIDKIVILLSCCKLLLSCRLVDGLTISIYLAAVFAFHLYFSVLSLTPQTLPYLWL